MLGIDDGHPRGTGVGEDGGALDATVGDGAAIFNDAAPFDSAIPVVTIDGSVVSLGCDPSIATVDPAHGVFVALGGTGGAPCTESAPCNSIQQGIEVANNAGVPTTVYVAGGAYVEQLSLRAGVTVAGGWSYPGWERLCPAQPVTSVRPLPGTTVSVIADKLNGVATLSTIEIGSEAAITDPGVTLVGILVTDTSTSLTLNNVEVSIANGGDGASGGAGATGPAATGTCEAGDGGVSTDIGAKGFGADAGWFASGTYATMTGGAGGQGGTGGPGTPGGSGTCVEQVTCTGAALCSKVDAGLYCGAEGKAGCGAPGGLGGPGGASGGSSIALLVWDATVSLSDCVLSALSGGNGGAGGAGGASGAPTNGVAGNPSQNVNTQCGTVTCQQTTGLAAGDGGSAGGTGGLGAPGGTGGDGAGGDSFAIVQGGSGKVHTINAPVLQHGVGGASADGGNGAPGAAGDQQILQ